MPAQPGELLGDVRPRGKPHHLLGHQRLVDLALPAQFLDPIRQSRDEPRLAGLGRHRQPLHQVGHRRTSGVQVRAQMPPLANAHLVQLAQGAVDRIRHRPLNRRPARLVGFPLPHDHRPGKPQQIARRQTPDRQPTSMRLLDGGGERLDQRLVQRDLDRWRCDDSGRHGQLDATTCHPPLHQPAQRRLLCRQQLRHADLHVEIPVVDASHGHADGRQLVLAAHRGESGHRLDHDVPLAARPALLLAAAIGAPGRSSPSASGVASRSVPLSKA